MFVKISKKMLTFNLFTNDAYPYLLKTSITSSIIKLSSSVFFAKKHFFFSYLFTNDLFLKH